MQTQSLIILVLLMSLLAYWYGMQRAYKVAGGINKVKKLDSLPSQFASLTAFWCGLPALIVLLIWAFAEPVVIRQLLVTTLPSEIQSLPKAQISLYLNDVYVAAAQQAKLADPVKQQAVQKLVALQSNATQWKTLLVFLIAISGVAYITSRFHAKFKARQKSETIVKRILQASSLIAILTTVGIVFSVLFESIRFFEAVPISDFLFGLQWSPQVAMRSDQVGASGAFGVIPLFAGTLLITFIAMLVSVPIGLMIAIYLSQYASPRLRAYAKPMLEILAGVPTVVYGFFAALTVAPFIRDLGQSLGLDVASESALAAGLVMGIMIIPFVSSLSDDAISAVPKALKEGSLGMGATLSETVKKVLLPAALPGIVGAILLAVSRAIGETMIVVMAAGMSANLTINPLESVTTVTVQIVTLLVGDQEFDSPKTLAAFALGLLLFFTTLLLNILALKVVRKYREQYD